MENVSEGDGMIEFANEKRSKIKIKVIGVGGAGCNAVSGVVQTDLKGVDIYAVNTDVQSLENCKASNKYQIGSKITKGLGAGGDPVVGKKSAEEDKKTLEQIIKKADIVFLTCGLGGGTGTGASPVIAEMAKKSGALILGVVTKPFLFEGRRRNKVAEDGLVSLQKKVDTLITISNQKLFSSVDKQTPVVKAFKMADKVLIRGVKAVSDLIVKPGLINLDFADVKAIIGNGGSAILGVGRGSGKERARAALSEAMSSGLLEDMDIGLAKSILINITGGKDLTLEEVNDVTSLLHDICDRDANIIFGAIIDKEFKGGELEITIIGTGLGHKKIEEKLLVGTEKKKKVNMELFPRAKGSRKLPYDSELDIPTFLRRRK